MGNELGGGGVSKTQFFMTKACWINNFITCNASLSDDPNSSTALIKNLGNLYALGHNGLICMGTADDDFVSESKSSFTNSVENGKDFGESLLAQLNSPYHFFGPIYTLLGAGSLRAQPYVQYGSDIEQNKTITTSVTLNLNQPILIQGVTVNGSGNWTVTSNNSSTPPGSHSEIVIRPETDLAGQVDIYAHP